MKRGIAVLLVFVAVLLISFLCTAGFVWLGLHILNFFGIAVALVFSWKLVIMIWIFLFLAKMIFFRDKG